MANASIIDNGANTFVGQLRPYAPAIMCSHYNGMGNRTEVAELMRQAVEFIAFRLYFDQYQTGWGNDGQICPGFALVDVEFVNDPGLRP